MDTESIIEIRKLKEIYMEDGVVFDGSTVWVLLVL
jgi:hypothetical protein